jgi:O-acetyl-ADP-ribose deacetylase (regulator of RNase III)
MVEFVTGNLLKADVDALVNTVNTKGVMGKAYRAACEAGEVQLGRMFVVLTGYLVHPRLIINFPTKQHWKSRSRIADIEAGLVDLRRVLNEYSVESVALPPLGCGLGGLEWSDVRPRIEAAMADMPVHVLVFEPTGAPAPDKMVDRRERPNMTPGRAAVCGCSADTWRRGSRLRSLRCRSSRTSFRRPGRR